MRFAKAQSEVCQRGHGSPKMDADGKRKEHPMSDHGPYDLSHEAVAENVEKIWRDALDGPPGQPELTFFDLQGQSISAVRIVARIKDEIGITVDVGVLFEDPDLATFTRAVLAAINSDENLTAS
jgi:peptidyl carrier protein